MIQNDVRCHSCGTGTLEMKITKAAVAMFEAEIKADAEKGNTMTRTAGLIDMQKSAKECRGLVSQLLAARARKETGDRDDDQLQHRASLASPAPMVDS